MEVNAHTQKHTHTHTHEDRLDAASLPAAYTASEGPHNSPLRSSRSHRFLLPLASFFRFIGSLRVVDARRMLGAHRSRFTGVGYVTRNRVKGECPCCCERKETAREGGERGGGAWAAPPPAPPIISLFLFFFPPLFIQSL